MYRTELEQRTDWGDRWGLCVDGELIVRSIVPLGHLDAQAWACLAHRLSPDRICDWCGVVTGGEGPVAAVRTCMAVLPPGRADEPTPDPVDYHHEPVPPRLGSGAGPVSVAFEVDGVIHQAAGEVLVSGSRVANCLAVCGEVVTAVPAVTGGGRTCLACAAAMVSAPPAAVSTRCSRSVRRAVAAWLRSCVVASAVPGRGVR